MTGVYMGGEIDTELESLAEARVRDTTQIRTTEAEHESLKVRLTDLEREPCNGRGVKLSFAA